ncbi:hypothetical protein SELMODRAFT_406364 [Selaginella moellendorffii]|uniref:Uncharacterized protein n=1 Tax=Selaginella moellendorffii TaxID=88036 RepID=D8R250_SELML|nr:uncharacterized protein LOC9659963 isoform X2 [Selaginella moellendorffii]EFJ34010.1 hypothetical protein SELMODRAFT_406364 [Selaginella moellendorffii]|eukprot:XP_002965172.1 uncharacterized protein LOC9659963 isoform X2 [Selaginella moellendorffii]
MVAAAGIAGGRSNRLHSVARRERSRPRASSRIAVESDEEDDGVHGGRMKPLASCCVNTVNTAARKPLAPLSEGGSSMDLLFLALESCSSGEKSNVARDQSREGEEDDNKGHDKENSFPLAQISSRKRKPEDNNYVSAAAVTPLFASAAVSVASRWLELLHLDLKGRLAALKRSRRNVRGVIVSGHIGRDGQWMQMFMNMDATLAAEGSNLENTIRKVQEMQRHCVAPPDENFDVEKFAGRVHHFSQQLSAPPPVLSESQINRTVTLAASAGAICSTASFALKES